MATEMNRRQALLHVSRSMSASELQSVIAELLDAAGLDRDQRVELLGGVFVSEAVRPYWEKGHSATDAHTRLQKDDPELADAVEAISPMLYGRAKARRDAGELIVELERRFQR